MERETDKFYPADTNHEVRFMVIINAAKVRSENSLNNGKGRMPEILLMP